jgi:hypothetical protein
VRLLFERLESGLITPQATIQPLSLLWYDSLNANGLPRPACKCSLRRPHFPTGTIRSMPMVSLEQHESAHYGALLPLRYDSLDANGLPRLLLVESCLLGFVTFFIAYELQAMRRQGLRSYWSDKSNWYERSDCP